LTEIGARKDKQTDLLVSSTNGNSGMITIDDECLPGPPNAARLRTSFRVEVVSGAKIETILASRGRDGLQTGEHVTNRSEHVIDRKVSLYVLRRSGLNGQLANVKIRRRSALFQGCCHFVQLFKKPSKLKRSETAYS
jgi:hypothetical protein